MPTEKSTKKSTKSTKITNTTKKTTKAAKATKVAKPAKATKAKAVKTTKPAPETRKQTAEERIKASNRRLITGAVIGGAAFCAAVAFGITAYNVVDNFPVWTSNLSSFITEHIIDGNSANFTEGSIAEVASRVTPAVVSITTETRTIGYYGQSSTSSAAGTGMIVTSDGYVITNKHVVDGASSINVVLDDGTRYTEVKLVGVDPSNDVAYLKISGVEDLPTVTLGNSKTITVGQQVIAIGNALGQFQNTVTEGIVSGTGRTIVAGDGSSSNNYYETLSDMIQTDASINAGNSGGPLVNAAGEVIGINTAVSNSANGLGFAIPISSVKGMLKSIIENGKAERAFLGVSYTNVTADTAKDYNLSVKYGAYVTGENSVIKDSPAEKAGIKSGDVIVAVNGVKVGQTGTLSSLISEYTVGDKVEITIVRDNKEINLKVTLSSYPTTLSR